MIDTKVYKTMLEAERDELLSELNSMGIKDPVTGDYNVLPIDNTVEADENDIATRDEGFEEDSALSETFNLQLRDIEIALQKIDSDSYGKCETCGAMIEENRLMANPSAKNCVAHINE